jgi:uncharacterized protein (TIGR02001 family)
MKTVLAPAAIWVVAVAPCSGRADEAASDAADRGWSASAGFELLSDDRLRGISQSDGLPALKGGFDLSHRGGFHAGAWAGNVGARQFPGGSGMGAILAGGMRVPLGDDLVADGGLNAYVYPGARVGARRAAPPAVPIGQRFDTLEIYGAVAAYGLSARLDLATGAYFGVQHGRGSWYADLTYNYAASDRIALIGHLGRRAVRGLGARPSASYSDYKVGVEVAAFDLTCGAALVGTDVKPANPLFYSAVDPNDGGSRKALGKSTVIVSVGKTFY